MARQLKAEVSVQLHKFTGDNRLVSPFGRNVAIVAYLMWYDGIYGVSEEPRLSEENYQKFLSGETATVYLTAKEDRGIQGIVLQCGSAGCRVCNRDSLTVDGFYNDDYLIIVPGRRSEVILLGEQVHNFLKDNPDDSYRVRDYLVQVWGDLYDINPEDVDFIKKLHDFDELSVGKTPKPQQATQPTRPQGSQQPAGNISVDIQSDDTTGYLNIGNGAFSVRPDLLYQIMSKIKADQGTTVTIDGWAERIAKSTRRAIGAYVSAAGGETSSAEANDRRLLELLGHKAGAINALFGKVPKDNGGQKEDNGEDGSKGKNAKDDPKKADDPLTVVGHFDYDCGFGAGPEPGEGPFVDLSRIKKVIGAIISSMIAPDNSLERMYKLANALAKLDYIVKEAENLKLDKVGIKWVYYQLDEAEVFQLPVNSERGAIRIGDKRYAKLWFGEIPET